jgi:hypothetical protein
MSVQEKRAWIYIGTALVVPVVYFAVVLRPGRDINTSPYVGLLALAIAGGVVLNIVIDIATSIGTSRTAARTDERDRQISRLGNSVAFFVISIASTVPLGLAIGQAPYFWIANTLYLAFVLSAIVSAGVRIVAYRRGI